MGPAGADHGKGAGLIGRLTALVVTPAVSAAVRSQRAGMMAARTDLCKRPNAIFCLSIRIVAPTVEPAVRPEAAGVAEPRAKDPASGERQKPKAIGLSGRLALVVSAPAYDSTIRLASA